MRRYSTVAAFVTGLVLAYMLISSCAALCVRMTRASGAIYALLAAGLMAFGLRSLLQEGSHVCTHAAAARQASLGWAFFNGGSLAFVASPCCTPILVSIAGLATSATLGFALPIAALFAIGHAVPLVAAATGATSLSEAMRSEGWGVVLCVINGAVLLALGGYYALLA